MKSVVYADVLLLVNFLIGYFLLRAAGLACAVPLPFGRNILGAVIAAVSTLMLCRRCHCLCNFFAKQPVDLRWCGRHFAGMDGGVMRACVRVT